MISNNKIVLIRNFILDEMGKMSSRVRIGASEIEVDDKKTKAETNFRFKVIKSDSEKTLLRIIYSAYEADKYVVKSSDETLPTEEVNELFYSIAQH